MFNFLHLHYHYHYSCLCLFDLCGDNFITTTFSSFHTGFCTLVYSLEKKFFFFSIRIYNSVYFLYCFPYLNRKQNLAYATNFFSSLFSFQYEATFFLLPVLCCMSPYKTKSHTYRSSHRRCSVKKVFLKMSQISQEKTVLESLF